MAEIEKLAKGLAALDEALITKFGSYPAAEQIGAVALLLQHNIDLAPKVVSSLVVLGAAEAKHALYGFQQAFGQFVERKLPRQAGETLEVLIRACAELFNYLWRLQKADIMETEAKAWMACWGVISETIRIVESNIEQGESIFLRYICLLQLLILSCSRTNVADNDMPIPDDINLDLIAKDHPCLRVALLREEGIHCLDRLISLAWQEKAKLASLRTATINALGRIGQQRATFMSKIVPVLIDLLESPTEYLTPHQEIFIMHTLARQFAILLENPSAEKFYPLVIEALRKTRAVATNTVEAARKRPALETSATPELDEDEAVLKRLEEASKRRRVEGIDVSSIPIAAAIEIVLGSLIHLPSDLIRSSIEAWRQSKPETPDVTAVRDPRRRQTAAPAPGAEEEAELKQEDFVFGYKRLTLDESNGIIDMQLRSVLESSHSNSAQLVRLVSLLAALRTDLLLQDGFWDFCFTNLSARMDLVINCLHICWATSPAAYPDNWRQVISRASVDSANWGTALARLLLEAPELSGQSHLEILDELFGDLSTRSEGLEVACSVAQGRPSERKAILELLLSKIDSEDEGLRKACAGALAGRLFSELSALLQDDAIASIHKVALNSDLSAERRCDALVAIASIVPAQLGWAADQLPPDALDYFRRSFKAYLEHVSSYDDLLISLEAIKDPILVEIILEDIGKKQAKLSDQSIACLVRNFSSGNWPASHIEPFMAQLDRNTLAQVIPIFVNGLEISDDAAKLRVANTFARIVERFPTGDFFILLHTSEAIALKRAIEATQICFNLTAIFRADVLAAAIQQMLELPSLPALFMRTLIQSLTLYKGLAGFVVGILGRLLARRIWEQPKLWEGFLRCVKILGPMSYSTLMQLPSAQLDTLLQEIPEMRAPFSVFLKQQSNSVQNSVAIDALRLTLAYEQSDASLSRLYDQFADIIKTNNFSGD